MAPEEPHSRPTPRRTRNAADRALVPRQAASCHVFFFPNSHRRGSDLGRIGSYRPNIGSFWPEKGNWQVREKKKKTLKPKIPVDLICHCRRLHRLNPFLLLLLLLFCFFVFFFLFFRRVVILFCCRFRPKFKDFSGPYRSVTHCSSSYSSLLLCLLLHRP